MQTESQIKPNNSKGWAAGFRNMLGEELNRWWSPRPLATQLILWTVIINGLVALIMTGNGNYYSTMGERINNGLMNFFNISSLIMPLAAIIIAHGSMLKERESGTAAWLLSKPLSRKAFVISKLLANSAGFFIIIVLAQGAMAYAQFSNALGRPMDAVPFFEGIVVLGIGCLFVLVLSIALGAFTASRSIALGIPLFIAIGGPIVAGIAWPDLSKYIPTSMATVGQYAPIPEMTITAVISMAIIILISVAAIWKFDRTEV